MRKELSAIRLTAYRKAVILLLSISNVSCYSIA